GEYVEWEEADLKSLSCKHLCLKTNMKVITNERQKVIIQGKVYWIRVKELDACFPNFQEDDQDDLSSNGESQKGDVANKADNNKSDADRVSESSFMHENDTAHKDVNTCKKGEVGSHSEDPFNINGILDGQKNNVCNSCSDEPKFPPGFTPNNNDQENRGKNIKDTIERVQSLSNILNDRCSNRGFSSQRSMNSHSQKSKVGGSILDLMDELVTVGQTMGYNMAGCLGNKAKRRWIKELCQKHRINFASIQETKAKSISLHTIKDLWGNQMFDHVVGSSVGCSGGYAFTWAHKSALKMSKLDRYLISEDLERTVTYEEVKRAVWDCGTNKSLGPDEFSFEFYRLKINIHKSKLMRIGVSLSVVAATASLIGCSILTAPFNYLGVKVGSNMSRITSWDDVISKVSSRLSKWKLKLISIGGRLSLLKSVLTSIPLYHMSIFKDPIGVLNHLKSTRRNFFCGVDGSDRKLAWTG
nr:RNA-directed DNA polymerase, eukaryota [Tanacetum cinerariifolium]